MLDGDAEMTHTKSRKSIAMHEICNVDRCDLRCGDVAHKDMLRLMFPRAKLRRKKLLNRVEVGAKNWVKNRMDFLGIFVLYLLCRVIHQISLKTPPNSSLHVLALKAL